MSATREGEMRLVAGSVSLTHNTEGRETRANTVDVGVEGYEACHDQWWLVEALVKSCG